MLHFELLKLMNFDFNADPDPAFHFNAEPEPASQNNADPCRSASAILVCTGSILVFYMKELSVSTRQ
jgi:hypothetical protein